jgi:enoyl-[acyl-carrier protein] reductase II
MLAAFSLGADGIQMGSRFVASKECSAHINFKNRIVDADDAETELTLKELTAVRLMKNDFFYQIKDAYSKNASVIELKKILGKGRAKKGMFEGDLKNGELEIGQVSALLDDILPVSEIMSRIILEYEEAVLRIDKFKI